MDLEASVVRTPDVEDEGWVPLQNTFSQNLTKQAEEEEYAFKVTKGTSTTLVHITFTGQLEDGEGDGGGGGGRGGYNLQEEMSFEKLYALHKQMVELYPSHVDDDCLPQLPTVPTGIWSYLLSIRIRDELYTELSQYLNLLASKCSVENVLVVFFADAFWSPSKYEEEWSELNRRHYLEEKEACQREVDDLLARRTQTQFRSMQELHDFYEEEDVAHYHLEKAREKLYVFQIRPFQDLSELAQQRRDEASKKASDPDLSVLEQMRALQEEREHHEQYLETRESLHELEIEWYHSIAEVLECKLLRAQEDKCHLGKAWDRKAQYRLDGIENKLNRTIVELLQVQCKRLADQKDHALLDMALVDEGPGMEEAVCEKEEQVYRIQVRLYEIQLRLMEEEERKLKLQANFAEGDNLAGIKHKLNHLPSKMSKIRLKLQACREQLDHPQKRAIDVEKSYSAHFAAQKKEEVAKREEEKRKQFRKEQRQKTIQRVKQYMEKNPVPVKKLPPRYQKPSQKQDSHKRHHQPAAKPQPQKPVSSRASTTAQLTRSAYKKSTGDKPKGPGTEKATPKGKDSLGSKGADKNNKVPHTRSSGQPSVQDLSDIARNLLPLPPPPSYSIPPPPPPPPPTLAPPPAPPQPVLKPVVKLPARRPAKQIPGGGGGGLDLKNIINARQKLRPTDLGRALGEGGMTSTTDEVACLIRSGAKAESSLTKDGANFLRQRIQHINTMTELSDPESDSEWDEA